MLISFRHAFAFLCMPKTGTTSIERALRSHAELICTGPPALKHTDYAAFETHFLPFLRAQGRLFDTGRFEVISAMREPLDWRYSWYRYRQRSDGMRNPERSTEGMSFVEFLEEHFSAAPRPFARLRSPVAFLSDAKGASAPVRLFQYEKLESLIVFLVARIGKPLKVPRLNVSPVAADRSALEAGRARFAPLLAEEYRLWETADGSDALVTRS